MSIKHDDDDGGRDGRGPIVIPARSPRLGGSTIARFLVLVVVIFAVLLGLRTWLRRRREAKHQARSVTPRAPFDVPMNVSSYVLERVPIDAVRVVAKSRLISLGDIHGDATGLRAVLARAGLIDAATTSKWIGGDAVLVQTGDMVDRGDESLEVMRVLASLQRQAYDAGGRVVVLLGNHEIMNLYDDFRFATAPETAMFGSLSARRTAFSRRGEFGAWLRRLPAAAVIGREGAGPDAAVLFVHGGLEPARLGPSPPEGDPLEELNARVKWMLRDYEGVALYQRLDAHGGGLFGDEGPFWSRFFALKPDEGVVCNALATTLELVHAGKMVVGHTVQMGGRARTRCGGRLVLGDVGFAPFYGAARRALEHHREGGIEHLKLSSPRTSSSAAAAAA